MANTSNTFENNLSIILKKINDITRNQFFIDVMLLIQGINFLIHPETAHKGIIEALSITVFFAALSILIGLIISHGFKKQNSRSIILAFVFIILSIITYLSAGHIAPAFHYFLAATIIASGMINILSAYHLTKLDQARKTLKTKLTTDETKDETIHTVSVSVEKTTKNEAERILSPAVIITEKISKFRYGQIIINLLLMITGVLMLLFRFETNAVLIRASGGILVFSAISDLVALLWTHRESKFVRKLTHYNQKSKK